MLARVASLPSSRQHFKKILRKIRAAGTPLPDHAQAKGEGQTARAHLTRGARARASLAQLLPDEYQARHSGHAGSGVQPDIARSGQLRPSVLRQGVQHAGSTLRGTVSLQVPLVLLRGVQDVRDHDRLSHVQVAATSGTPVFCDVIGRVSDVVQF